MLADFHFLRPEALWLLPLAFLLWGILRRKARQSNSWSQVLPPEFLKVLAPASVVDNKRMQSWGWPVILVLGLLALAGPTLSKQETPAGIKEDPVVVVFDLSLSMLATDQSPNRLKRGQQKLYDLIEQRKEGQTGLVVFAGSSHVVTPLTEDIATLKAMIPALDPFIMPDLGSNAAAGIETAIATLKQAGSPQGRILMLTDGVEDQDLAKIASLLNDAKVSLSIIGVGTEDGGPIPIPNRGFIKDGESIVVAKPNFEAMRDIATGSGGRFNLMTLNSQDIRYTLPDTLLERGQNSDTQTSLDWQDAGYWLLFPIVVMVLWQYRRSGAVLCLLIICLNSQDSYAFGWKDLWKTPDQQAQQAYDEQQYKDAASLYQDSMHKGMALYKEGDFAAAAKAFSSVDSAEAHFNRGNALVEQQQFEDALKAYQQALDIDPQLEAAETNKKKLEEFLENQQQNQQKNRDRSSDSSNKSKDQSQNQSQENQQDQQNSQDGQSQQNKDQQQGQQGQQGQNNTRSSQNSEGPDQQQDSQGQEHKADQNEQNAGSDKQLAQNKEKQGADQQSTALNKTENGESKDSDTQVAGMGDDNVDLKEQQTEQWLRRIPDDPGGLLRRKFLQQYQSKKRNRSGDGGGRTIW